MDELSPGRRWDDRVGDVTRDDDGMPQTFEAFVEMIPDPVVVSNGSTVVTGNKPFAELFDRDVSDIRGTSLETLFPDLTWDAIEANCGADAGEYLTCRAGTETGDDVWVDLSFARRRVGGRGFVVGTIHDVTERRERTWQLEEYKRIVEAIEDGVYTLDESFTIETVNEAVESMTGHDRETLVGSPATLLADDSVIDAAAEMSQQLLSGERDFATLTTELDTADGDSVPIETRFTAHRRDDGSYRQVGVVRDISDRRRFERTLAALHDSTRELLKAETAGEVSELIVASATDVLDADDAAVYQFDTEDNVLEPRTLSASLEDTADVPDAVGPGESPLWESFVSGDLRLLDPDDHPFPTDGVSGAACLPLGEHGVFYVAIDVDEYDADTIEVLELLAASGEAALARVDREQSLRERDEELREQNRELRQLEEINGIIRRIHQVLVDADTCSEIEQAVCDQLAQSKWTSFAWLGRLDAGELEPRAWAGDSPDYLDAISLTTSQDGGPPSIQTARTEESTVVPAVADGLRSEPWRREGVSRNYLSAISVPLRYDEFTYGVLTVYGTERSAFEEMLESVFVELGETIANAIREVESRQRRSAATATELEVALVAPNAPLSQIADCVGEPVVCEGTVPQAGDATRLFFRVDGDVSSESVRAAGESLTRVASLNAITDDDTAVLFEAVVQGDTVTQTLLDDGARIESVRADTDGSLAATVHLSRDVDVREFVERLADRYQAARLAARRERTVPSQTESGIHAAVEGQLTDRQREVFRTAYYSGFFDWPRKTSGQEIAERLDISQPTVSRHLRVAERKLLELVFGERGREH